MSSTKQFKVRCQGKIHVISSNSVSNFNEFKKEVLKRFAIDEHYLQFLSFSYLDEDNDVIELANDDDFDTDEVLVFVHCREPEEIAKFVKEMNAITLLIRRTAIETNEQSNHADAEVFNYDYDYVVENNGTLEELEESAITFLREIFREKNLKIC